jgi:hypothetical protein
MEASKNGLLALRETLTAASEAALARRMAEADADATMADADDAAVAAQLAADLTALDSDDASESDPLGELHVGWNAASIPDVRPLASLEELLAGAEAAAVADAGSAGVDDLFGGLEASLRAGDEARDRFSTEFASLQALAASVPEEQWAERREQTASWRPPETSLPQAASGGDPAYDGAAGRSGDVPGSVGVGGPAAGGGGEPWWLQERRARAAEDAARETAAAAARETAEAARRGAQEAAERAAAVAAAELERELQQKQTALLEAEQVRQDNQKLACSEVLPLPPQKANKKSSAKAHRPRRQKRLD